MTADDRIPEVTLVFEDGHREGPDTRQGRPTFQQRPRAGSPEGPTMGGRAGRGPLRSADEGHALPVPGLPVAVLGATLGVMALVGVVTTSLATASLPAGVVVASAMGTSAGASVAAGIASAVFGPLGMTLLVFASLVALGARPRVRSLRFPLLVVMGSAWVATGLVATVTGGAAPFLASAVAASAATGAAVTMLVRRDLRLAAALLGGILAVAVAASLVWVGTVSLVGALASLVVGATGALLGAAVWNHRWAAVMDMRDAHLARSGMR